MAVKPDANRRIVETSSARLSCLRRMGRPAQQRSDQLKPGFARVNVDCMDAIAHRRVQVSGGTMIGGSEPFNWATTT